MAAKKMALIATKGTLDVGRWALPRPTPRMSSVMIVSGDVAAEMRGNVKIEWHAESAADYRKARVHAGGG